MAKVIFKIASNKKLAEFIFDLRYTLDSKKLNQLGGSSCIFVSLSPSTKKELSTTKKFSNKLKKMIMSDLEKNYRIEKDIFEEYKKEVEKKWKILEKEFFKELKKIIPIKFRKEYTCYISRAVINAYFFKKDVSLEFYELKDKKESIKKRIIEKATSIVAEEILHLIYFDYWNKVFKKNYSYEQVYDLGTNKYSGWLISEIVPEFILIENPLFKKYGWDKVNRVESGYFWIPKHKNKLRKIWNTSNFKDFLIETHKDFKIE